MSDDCEAAAQLEQLLFCVHEQVDQVLQFLIPYVERLRDYCWSLSQYTIDLVICQGHTMLCSQTWQLSALKLSNSRSYLAG